MKAAQRIIHEKRIVVHLVFCAGVVLTLLAGTWFLQSTGFELGDIHIIACRFLFFVVCIYAGRWLCAQWYLKNRSPLRMLPYAFVCCLMIAVAWWLMIRYVLGAFHAGLNEVVVSAAPFFLIGIISGMLLKLVRVTMQQQVQEAQTIAEQKQGELELLQSQLSPHFLFNTLNNLYGISITRHEQVPELLLKLSDLLRYTVYETKRPFVPLWEELAYIKNYIDFENMRMSDRLVLQTDLEVVNNKNILVAPMVLIVFVENAFKHTRNTLDATIRVSISLKLAGNNILFSVRNSYSDVKSNHSISGESSGIGLQNTMKRLTLLYGNTYKLDQYADNGLYTVELSLPIK
jgi:sensor histidine kinase YesM